MTTHTNAASQPTGNTGTDDAVLRPIDLNELPRWSPWPARLLDPEFRAVAQRDLAKIEAEYDRDKWLTCLEAYRGAGASLDPVQLRLGAGLVEEAPQRAAMLRGQLCLMTGTELMPLHCDILASAMAKSLASSRTAVELGCGIGHILWLLRRQWPELSYRGGEYSDNAVTLAAELYAGMPNLSVQKFNFYDPTYRILEEAEGPITIFTSQAIEQIPSARHIIDMLGQYREKIAAVFHLEPSYELYDDSLLGLMRRRYIEVNDYNRDLVGELERRPDIQVLRQESDVIGWNPFNSLALTHWSFRDA